MTIKRRLLGVFADPQEAAEAAKVLQKAGNCHIELYLPVPDHHLLDVAPPRWKPVRYFTIIGGLLGLVSGFALAIWTAVFQVGGDGTWEGGLWLNGMSPASPIPFVIVGFEVTILIGGLMTMLGLLIGTRLPKLFEPPLWDVRLSEDHFGVGVDCTATYADRLAKVLEEHGAEHVHRAH
jgi:hypothetical protein